MFEWTSESMRWRRTAEEYTGFYSKLAEKLTSLMSSDDSLYDIGCGMGQLSAALAPAVCKVTGVDISYTALEYAQDSAHKLGINNITFLRKDWRELSEQYDVALLCYFGKLTENFNQLFPLCGKRMITVVSNGNGKSFVPDSFKRTKKQDVSSVEDFLNRTGIAYTLQRFSLEFGQPFDDLEDAKSFLRHYAPGISDEAVRLRLKEEVQYGHVGGARFYFPHMRSFGIFSIDRPRI